FETADCASVCTFSKFCNATFFDDVRFPEEVCLTGTRYSFERLIIAHGLKIANQSTLFSTSYRLEVAGGEPTIALQRREWKGEIDLARNRDLTLVVIRSCEVSWLLCLGSEGPVLVGIARPDGYSFFIFFRFTRWT